MDQYFFWSALIPSIGVVLGMTVSVYAQIMEHRATVTRIENRRLPIKPPPWVDEEATHLSLISQLPKRDVQSMLCRAWESCNSVTETH